MTGCFPTEVQARTLRFEQHITSPQPTEPRTSLSQARTDSTAGLFARWSLPQQTGAQTWAVFDRFGARDLASVEKKQANAVGIQGRRGRDVGEPKGRDPHESKETHIQRILGET